MNEAKPDPRQEFLDQVIDAIECGRPVPWDQLWTGDAGPQNAGSGHECQDQRFLSIKDAMARDGLKFETGSAAFYLRDTDSVVTPPANAFKDVGGYQATVLHEIGHATGAAHRLSRDGITGDHAFGSEGYAKEELRAEFFSVFIAMETGIERERDERHATYLKNWVAVATDDKSEFLEAAAEAARAVDYVIGKEREMLQEREATQAEAGREFDLGL